MNSATLLSPPPTKIASILRQSPLPDLRQTACRRERIRGRDHGRGFQLLFEAAGSRSGSHCRRAAIVAKPRRRFPQEQIVICPDLQLMIFN